MPLRWAGLGKHSDMQDAIPRRQLIVEEIVDRTGIDDAMIENLVRTFYGRVRLDSVIGPVFETRVKDWEAHTPRLCAFWSSVALMSGRYHGQPIAVHLPLPIDTAHFDRWLEIFAATVREVCPPAAADHFLERAFRIADSLELGIAAQRGEDRAIWPRLADRSPAASLEDGAPEFSSPACSMHEARDEYMGYAGRDELTPFLNELLEAERAGARVTLESAREASSGSLGALMRSVQENRAHWCALLVCWIQTLGGQPSSRTGTLYNQAMAIADLPERMAFINSSQRWMVRRLREFLPRVRDESLHASLSQMLKSHEANIELLNGLP
jgi:hemoglobin